MPSLRGADGPSVVVYIDSLGTMIDVDDSGEVDPLSDGLMILRPLFGFSGPTLINGAIENDCARCDAGAVAAYIDGLAM
jgi:hypothetical protein